MIWGLKCIATRTIGYDHIDVEYAKELGLGVIHISYSPNSVADYTIMMMLMGCRKMKHIMERAAIQDYTLKGKLGQELPDCTVGIIGTGRIGRTVIRHLSGFGCKMLAYDLYENDEVKQYAQYTDLETLYKECDIITLHAPATEDNYHMIGTDAIAKMKQDVIIINCARGALIDTDALIDGIESGKVGFAGLDVVEHESGLYYFDRMGEPLHNPRLAILRSYSNVVCQPAYGILHRRGGCQYGRKFHHRCDQIHEWRRYPVSCIGSAIGLHGNASVFCACYAN